MVIAFGFSFRWSVEHSISSASILIDGITAIDGVEMFNGAMTTLLDTGFCMHGLTALILTVDGAVSVGCACD